MSIHRTDPHQRPDHEFEPATLGHLVVGTEGRLLDARRTPVRLVDLCDRTGQFTVEILAFEDVGARWTRPYEDVGRFQFEKRSRLNSASKVREIAAIVERLDRRMTIPCDPHARAETREHLEEETAQVRSWLRGNSIFIAEGAVLPDPELRQADPRLLDDFARFMDQLDLQDVDDRFSRIFVSAPFGELIKGHRIVIAEMGLVPYEGKVIRDERIFDDPWSKERRAFHIVSRLAFVRALAAELGIESFTLFRGISSPGPLQPQRNETFVSATFSRTVAESLSTAHGPDGAAALMSQTVPIDRLFMTYLETAAMNRQYKEAEAVLLFNEENPVF
ncbi:MAG: hypothetical protein JSV91_03570 [Phycisphaerales bacterium]|nr:MAG: hypothetical protein JSV91_03570 [Phycisphaerales bacterium]